MKLNNKQKAILDEKFKNHLAVGKDIIKDWSCAPTIFSLRYETVLWLKQWEVIDSLENVRDFADLKEDEDLIRISVDLFSFNTKYFASNKITLISGKRLIKQENGSKDNGLYNVVIEGTRSNLTEWISIEIDPDSPDIYLEDNLIKGESLF
jgi:hypothetical protein